MESVHSLSIPLEAVVKNIYNSGSIIPTVTIDQLRTDVYRIFDELSPHGPVFQGTIVELLPQEMKRSPFERT